MAKRNNKQIEYNADFSVNLAEGFYAVGHQIAKQIHKDTGYFGFIGLAPGVVNFNLSAELYVKAIHLTTLHYPAKGHHLWNLFKNLPLEVKNTLESSYIDNQKDIDEELSSYRITITKVKKEEEEKDSQKSEPTGFNCVKDLLMLHNDAFEKFRYLHEFPSETGYDYEYNFDEMNAFILALKSYAFDLIKSGAKHLEYVKFKS